MDARMKGQIKLVLFCAIVLPVIAFDRSQYTNSKQLTDGYVLHWKMSQTSDEIALGLEVTTLGWVGFGIGEFSSGSMPGSDVVIIQKNSTNGHIYAQDRYTDAYAEPKMDDCPIQDWVLVSASESDGKTFVELTRSLSARDNQDRPFLPGDNAIIIAWGNDNAKTIKYHGSNRLTTILCFWNCATVDDTSKTPGAIVMRAAMPNITIPADETTYLCYAVPFNTTNDADSHIVHFHFSGDSRSNHYVHHMLFHLCEYFDEKDGRKSIPEIYAQPAQCTHTAPSPLGYPGCTLLYAWARGGRPLDLPAEAGFRIRSTDKSKYYFVLDMHYNNPQMIGGVIDASAIEMVVTSELRQYDASTLSLGDPGIRLPEIPPGMKSWHVETTCPNQCTEKFAHDIQVFSDYFHMHEIGKIGWSWIHRDEASIPLNRVEYYAFANQHSVPVNITLKRGDRINTHCVWDSTTRTEPTKMSTASTDEMCIEFLTYYPALPKFPLCAFMSVGGYQNVTLCGNDLMLVANPSIPDPPGGLARVFGTSDTTHCSPVNSPATRIYASLAVVLFGALSLLH